MIEMKDIITLSDDKDYQVISKINYEGLVYYYLVDMQEISNCKFMYENDDNLTEIDDEELISRLMPIMFKKFGESF